MSAFSYYYDANTNKIRVDETHMSTPIGLLNRQHLENELRLWNQMSKFRSTNNTFFIFRDSDGILRRRYVHPDVRKIILQSELDKG